MIGKTLLHEIKEPIASRNGPTPTSSKLDEAAHKSADEVLEMLGTSAVGLSEGEAAFAPLYPQSSAFFWPALTPICAK